MPWSSSYVAYSSVPWSLACEQFAERTTQIDADQPIYYLPLVSAAGITATTSTTTLNTTTATTTTTTLICYCYILLLPLLLLLLLLLLRLPLLLLLLLPPLLLLLLQLQLQLLLTVLVLVLLLLLVRVQMLRLLPLLLLVTAATAAATVRCSHGFDKSSWGAAASLQPVAMQHFGKRPSGHGLHDKNRTAGQTAVLQLSWPSGSQISKARSPPNHTQSS